MYISKIWVPTGCSDSRNVATSRVSQIILLYCWYFAVQLPTGWWYSFLVIFPAVPCTRVLPERKSSFVYISKSVFFISCYKKYQKSHLWYLTSRHKCLGIVLLNKKEEELAENGLILEERYCTYRKWPNPWREILTENGRFLEERYLPKMA